MEMFFGIIALMSILIGAAVSIVSASTSMQIYNKVTGAAFGVSHAVHSIGRSTMPMILGFFYSINPSYIWINCFVIAAICATIAIIAKTKVLANKSIEQN